MQATAVPSEHCNEVTALPVGLDTGAPAFDWEPALYARLQEALQAGLEMDYPPVQGLAELRQAIAVIHRRELGLAHGADQVLITYGAMQAIFLVCAYLLSPEDEVLLPSPFWFRFPDILAGTGAPISIIPTTATTAYKLTPAQLVRHIGPRTRLLVLIQPNNPTGAVYSHAELEGLAAVLEGYPRLLVLADEAYNQLSLARPPRGGFTACESIGSWPLLADRVFTVNSLSKNYAAAGLRIGYVAGPAAHMAALTERLRLVTLGVSAPLQRAALCLLNARHLRLPRLTARLRARCHRGTNVMKEVLGIHPRRPDAGYYFWIDAAPWLIGAGGGFFQTDSDLASYLLREAGVAVVPGSQCGLPGFLRLTFAVPEPLFDKGLRAMQKALALLRT